MAPRYFFDIETGGFQGERSSILSISWAKGYRGPTSRFAAPEPGSSISRWSENKVWEPIKHKKLHSEQAVLMDFLKVLEGAPDDTQLVGWNIGYQPTAQGSTRAGGFDVQFLITRARQHGLDAKYQKELKRMKLFDLGSIYAYRIAKALTEDTTGYRLMKEGVLHKDLLQEASGFMKQAGRMGAEQGIRGEAALAEALSRENVRFSGWKQEMVFDLLNPGAKYAAHQSEADINALQKIFLSGKEIDEPFLRRWSRMALENKFVSRAKFVPREVGEAVPARYTAIMKEAAEWGMREPVEQKLRTMAAESGIPFSRVEAGVGIPTRMRTVAASAVTETVSRAGGGRFAQALDLAGGFVARHPGKFAIAASAVALATLKGAALFSGSDDEYNVIEGFQHQGMAGATRRQYGFGSGWIGQGGDFLFKTNAGKSIVGGVAAGLGVGLITGSASAGYQTAMGVIGGANIGALKGQAVGGAIVGGGVLGAAGLASSEYLGAGGSMALGAITTSVAASMMTAGSLRGGLLYKDTIEALTAHASKADLAGLETQMKMYGVDLFGPTGFATTMSNMVGSMNKAVGGGGHLGKAAELMEKYPLLTRYADAAMGSPSLINLATKTGGIEKATSGQLAGAVWQDILEGVPLGIGFGGIGLAGSALFGEDTPDYSGANEDEYVKKEIAYVRKHGDLPDAMTRARWRANTVQGFQHGGMSSASRPEYGFGSPKILSKIVNFASEAMGVASRTAKTGTVLAKENTKAVGRMMRKDIIPGALKLKPLETVVATATVAESAHMALGLGLGTMGPVGMTAGVAGLFASKYAYAAIKNRKLLQHGVLMAVEYPTQAKRVVKFGVSEVLDYVLRGKQGPVGSFIEFGGGKLGRQAALAEIEIAAGMPMREIRKARRKLFDRPIPLNNTAANGFDGLQHGGMSSHSRPKSGFGSRSDSGFLSRFADNLFRGIRTRMVGLGVAASVFAGGVAPAISPVSTVGPMATITSFTPKQVDRLVTPPRVGREWVHVSGDPRFYPGEQSRGSQVSAKLGLADPKVVSEWPEVIETIKKSGKKKVFLEAHGMGGTAFGLFQGKENVWTGKMSTASVDKVSVASAAWIGQQLPPEEGYKVIIGACNARSSLRSNRGLKIEEVNKAAARIGDHITSVYDVKGYTSTNVYVPERLGLGTNLEISDLTRSTRIPLTAEKGVVNPFLLEAMAERNVFTNIPTKELISLNTRNWGTWKHKLRQKGGLENKSLRSLEATWDTLMGRQSPFMAQHTEIHMTTHVEQMATLDTNSNRSALPKSNSKPGLAAGRDVLGMPRRRAIPGAYRTVEGLLPVKMVPPTPGTSLAASTWTRAPITIPAMNAPTLASLVNQETSKLVATSFAKPAVAVQSTLSWTMPRPAPVPIISGVSTWTPSAGPGRTRLPSVTIGVLPYTPKPPVWPAPGFSPELEAMGDSISQRINALKGDVAHLKVALAPPRPSTAMEVIPDKIGKNTVVDIARKQAVKAPGIGRGLKIAGGLGAVLAVIGAGAMMFSGKDDEHNTIEGMRHGGQAQQMRHRMTPFGSGARGLIKISEAVESLWQAAKGGRQAAGSQISKSELPALWKAMQSHAPKIHEGLLPAQRKGFEQAVKGLEKDFRAAIGSQFEGIAFVSIGGVKKQAKVLGVPFKEVLRGTIKHERFHQAVSQLGLREPLARSTQGPFTSKWLSTTGVGYKDSPYATEEFLAAAITFKQYKPAEASLAQLVKAEKGFMTTADRTALLSGAEPFIVKLPKHSPMELLSNRTQLRKQYISALGLGGSAPPPVPVAKALKTTPPPLPRAPRAGIVEPGQTGRSPAHKNRRIRMEASHRRAQVSSSANALRPGKRHRQQTGRLVT